MKTQLALIKNQTSNVILRTFELFLFLTLDKVKRAWQKHLNISENVTQSEE